MKRLLFALVLICPVLFAQDLIIGTTRDYPPFSSLADQNNHFYGFEIDIMNEICTRLQTKCQFRPVVVSTIVDELKNGHIDFAIAAIIIPSAPLPDLVFSLPYLPSNAQFMTLKSSNIEHASDIKNKRVGVRRGTLGGGTIFKDMAIQMYNGAVTVRDYASMNDLMAALGNKRVDVIFSNEAALKYWYFNDKDSYRLIGNKVIIGNGYGIMSTTKYEAMMRVINQIILQMMSDGSYLKIYNQYFGFQ